MAATELPTLVYPLGASMPDAVVGCPGGGGMAGYDDIEVKITKGSPGGDVLLTIPTGQITTGMNTLTVAWTEVDLGSLPEREYGITVLARLGTEYAKWTGVLLVTAAAV